MNIKQLIPWLRPATVYDVLGFLCFIITVSQILAGRSHKQQLVLVERKHEQELDVIKRESASQIQQWRGRAILFGSLALFVFAVLLIASRKA